MQSLEQKQHNNFKRCVLLIGMLSVVAFGVGVPVTPNAAPRHTLVIAPSIASAQTPAPRTDDGATQSTQRIQQERAANAATAPGFLMRTFRGILLVVANIIYGGILAAVWVLALLLKIMLPLATYSNFIHYPPIQAGWAAVRDLGNLAIILVLLVISIATIVRYEAYNYKKLLPKLLVMAVLVNFSLTITGIFIDGSQVIMYSFIRPFTQNEGQLDDLLLDTLSITSITEDIAGQQANVRQTAGSAESVDEVALGIDPWGLIVAHLVALMMIIVAMFVIFAMVIILINRIIMLWFLSVLSPLAYILSTFPQGQKYAQQWWTEFGKYLVVGPSLAFFLWLSFLVAGADANSTRTNGNELVTELESGMVQQGEAPDRTITSFAGVTLPPETPTPGIWLRYVIGIALLMGALEITQQLGVKGGQIAGKSLNWLQSRPGALMTKGIPTMAAWANRKVYSGEVPLVGKYTRGLNLNPLLAYRNLKDYMTRRTGEQEKAGQAAAGFKYVESLGKERKGIGKVFAPFGRMGSIARLAAGSPQDFMRAYASLRGVVRVGESVTGKAVRPPKLLRKPGESDADFNTRQAKAAKPTVPLPYYAVEAYRSLENEAIHRFPESMEYSEVGAALTVAEQDNDTPRFTTLHKKAAKDSNDNEFLNDAGYWSGAYGGGIGEEDLPGNGGMMQYGKDVLVGKMGMTGQQMLQSLTDIGYINEDRRHGANARLTRVENGVYVANNPVDQAASIMNEYFKGNIRSNLQNSNRLAYGFESSNGEYRIGLTGAMLMAGVPSDMINFMKRNEFNPNALSKMQSDPETLSLLEEAQDDGNYLIPRNKSGVSLVEFIRHPEKLDKDVDPKDFIPTTGVGLGQLAGFATKLTASVKKQRAASAGAAPVPGPIPAPAPAPGSTPTVGPTLGGPTSASPGIVLPLQLNEEGYQATKALQAQAVGLSQQMGTDVDYRDMPGYDAAIHLSPEELQEHEKLVGRRDQLRKEGKQAFSIGKLARATDDDLARGRVQIAMDFERLKDLGFISDSQPEVTFDNLSSEQGGQLAARLKKEIEAERDRLVQERKERILPGQALQNKRKEQEEVKVKIAHFDTELARTGLNRGRRADIENERRILAGKLLGVDMEIEQLNAAAVDSQKRYDPRKVAQEENNINYANQVLESGVLDRPEKLSTLGIVNTGGGREAIRHGMGHQDAEELDTNGQMQLQHFDSLPVEEQRRRQQKIERETGRKFDTNTATGRLALARENFAISYANEAVGGDKSAEAIRFTNEQRHDLQSRADTAGLTLKVPIKIEPEPEVIEQVEIPSKLRAFMNSLVGKRAVRAAMPLVAKSGASLTPSEQAAVRRNALQRDIAKNSKQQKGLAQRLSGASGFAKNSQQAYQAATVARQEQEKQVATSKKFQEDRLKEISQLRRESEAALVSGDSKIYRSKLDNARYTQAAYDNGEKILQGHTSKLNELRQAEQQKKGEYSNSLANVQEVKRLHDGNVRKVKLQETLDGFQGDLAAIDAGELDGGALTPDDVVKLKEGIRKMITRTEQQLAGIPIGGKIRQPAERPAPSVKPQTSTPKPRQPRDDELIPTVKSPHAPAGSSAVDTQQAEQQAIQRVFNAIEAASRAGQPLPSRAELMRNPQMALAQAQELIKAMAKKTEEDPQSLDENLRGIEAVLASMHDVLGKTEQKLDLSQLSAEINKVQEARSAGKEINLRETNALLTLILKQLSKGKGTQGNVDKR